jgi:hypothetical protein
MTRKLKKTLPQVSFVVEEIFSCSAILFLLSHASEIRTKRFNLQINTGHINNMLNIDH